MLQSEMKRESAYDVFISYSSKNKAVTDALCHYLEENKIRCWMAPRDIQPGKEYGDIIDQAIREARVFVLVFSQNSLNSNWVRKETNLAVSDGKIIIPFRIEECALTGAMRTYLNDVHWIDAIPRPDQAFGDLAKAILSILGMEGSTSPVIPQIIEKDCTGFIAKDAAKESAYAKRRDLTKVVIPEGVIEIGNHAFEKCVRLTSIIIPDSVTKIGDHAFSGCEVLTSITIPDRLTKIGDFAFCGCVGLTSVTLPECMEEIGICAFTGCQGLTSIYIPDSVTKIGEEAFSWCAGLTSIVIPNRLTEISRSAFVDCRGLISIEIPETVKEIGNYAFANCEGLTWIHIPDSVTKIGEGAFHDCKGLTSVYIPDSVVEIGERTFAGCVGLTSVTLPDHGTEIGTRAFEGCCKLNDIDGMKSLRNRIRVILQSHGVFGLIKLFLGLFMSLVQLVLLVFGIIYGICKIIQWVF